MDYKEAKRLLLKDPKLREEFRELDLSWEIAKNIIEARLASGLSQAQLAKKIGTKQPCIARIESGNHTPSLNILQKIAKALKTELVPPTFKSIVQEVRYIQPSTEMATYSMQPTGTNHSLLGYCSQLFPSAKEEEMMYYNLISEVK